MPITKDINGKIVYSEPSTGRRSEDTGTVNDEDFAIIDKTNVLKQVQFAINPTSGVAGTVTLQVDVGSDATLNLSTVASAAFATINAPSGTDPVASGTDTLNLTSADNSLTITGNSGTNTVNFSVNVGSETIAGDVTGTLGASTVSAVGGSTAANVHAAELLTNAATSANTNSAIVRRDSSGNFSATTVTANLTGNASGSAASFTGTLVGDVTGTQGATVVGAVGGSTAANVHAAELLANAATNVNTLSAIVKRDSSGNFIAGNVTANITGNVTGNLTGNVTGNTSGSAASFTGNLAGDVTGTQGATVVGSVGGSTAANINTAEVRANAATNANLASTIVFRNSSGNFSAGTITASLTGTASGNTTYTPSNHGIVVSSGTNAMTVVTPDASTAKALVSGGSSADPSWALLTNTNLSGSAAITNANLASMSTVTIKGNSTGGSATPSDLSVTTVTSMLNNVVGDSGSGGTKGLVPAPASGDAAANRFLKADGTWTTVPMSFVGLVEEFTGMIESPSAKTYILDQSAAYGYTINTLIITTVSGTITAAVKINGTSVTGISAVSVSSTPATGTGTAANTVVAGDKITLVTTSNSSSVDMSFTLKVTRT